MKPKILIVEDEEAILTGLRDVFTFHGYDIDWATDGKGGLEKIQTQNYHLLLLDVMLPHVDGFTLCEKARQKDRSVSIIMLTAKGDEKDILKGLELGADDYLSKPFSVQELLARVKAVLRRSPKLLEDQQILSWNDFKIDCENLIFKKENEEIELTKREVDLLRYLIQFSSRPVSRQELLKEVWGYNNPNMDTRTVDIHVTKLRKKVENDPQNPELLLTVRGKGYKIHNS